MPNEKDNLNEDVLMCLCAMMDTCHTSSSLDAGIMAGKELLEGYDDVLEGMAVAKGLELGIDKYRGFAEYNELSTPELALMMLQSKGLSTRRWLLGFATFKIYKEV